MRKKDTSKKDRTTMQTENFLPALVILSLSDVSFFHQEHPLFLLFGSSDINLLKYPIKMENKAKCKGVIISCTLVKTKCF